MTKLWMLWPTLSAGLLALLGYVTMKWQSSVRVGEAQALSNIKTSESPYRILEAQLMIKDGQLKLTQEKFFQYIETQSTRNELETRALDALTAKVEAQTQALLTHTSNSTRQANEIHSRLNGMAEDLAVLRGIKSS